MYLVSQGADIHTRNDKAFTDAEYNGHGDVVEFLSDMSGKDYLSPRLQFEDTKYRASKDVFISSLPLGSLIYDYYAHLSSRDE